MNADAARAFFLWCTLLNGAFLVLTALVLSLAGGWVYRLHSRWFPMPRDTFNCLVYGILAFYKIVVIALCLVPWLALTIISRA